MQSFLFSFSSCEHHRRLGRRLLGQDNLLPSSHLTQDPLFVTDVIGLLHNIIMKKHQQQRINKLFRRHNVDDDSLRMCLCNMQPNFLKTTMAAIALLLLLLPSTDGLSLSRRKWLRNGILAGSGGILLSPDAANAARGAFELDMEYYMRDLVGGNSKEGNVLPSSPPSRSAPRSLSDPLLSLLLNDDCSSACLSTLALVQAVQRATKRDEKSIESDIQQRTREYRAKASRSFSTGAPWQVEHVSDQYYFDLTAYALWRTAADLLPNYPDRDRFVRNVGRLLYEKARAEGILRQPQPRKGSLVGTVASMTELLDAFTSAKFCKGYRIGEQSKDKKEEKRIVFDELDDDALASGLSVDCLVSVFEPVTLGANLQITGEGSRFAPDFVAATLAAVWETAGIQSSWETFFVDPEYRPNPKDYFPNEQLLQFTLSFTR
jgi:hypothetical protein